MAVDEVFETSLLKGCQGIQEFQVQKQAMQVQKQAYRT
jgi:hypothetical protein